VHAWRFLLASSLLASAVVVGGSIKEAWGGAWLMPPDEGQAIVYSDFSDSNRAFDSQGHLIPVQQYRKFELGTYIEYGLTDWLTLVVAPAYDRIRNPLRVSPTMDLGRAWSPQGSRCFKMKTAFSLFRPGCALQAPH
jgi:hypothetical protein